MFCETATWRYVYVGSRATFSADGTLAGASQVKSGNRRGLPAASSYRQGVGLDCESVGGFDGFPDAGERYFEDVDHFVVSVRFVGGSGGFF